MITRPMKASLVLVSILTAGNVFAVGPEERQIATRGFDPAAAAARLAAFTNDIRETKGVVQPLALDAVPAADSVEAAKSFLDSNALLFRSPLEPMTMGEAEAPTKGLELARKIESEKRTHVTFDQKIRDLPVVGNQILVHLDEKNRVQEFSGGLVPEATIVRADFTLASDAAIEKAVAHLEATQLRGETRSQKAWLPTEGGLVAVHEVKVPAAQPLGDFIVYVDAGDGRVHAVEDAMCHAFPTAKVYGDHPSNSGLETFELKDLGGDKKKLTGPYANVLNEDTDEATSNGGKFDFPITDTHFDEAMVYTHLEIVHRFHKQVLKFNKMDFSIKATVHYGDKYDNAFYSPWGKELAFGDGNRLNPLSRESGVVYHEYGHAVCGEMCNLRGSEGGAMNEGYGDYTACTINDDPKMGEYAVEKMGRPYMRLLTSTKHYPEDLKGEVHADGEIWGSACWDLRIALGRQVADRLVHESRNYLGSSPNFSKGLGGIVKADETLFNGQHVQTILQKFNARGIQMPAVNSRRTVAQVENFRAIHSN